MTRALFLVSGDYEADEASVARGDSPRKDYIELAAALDGDVFDFGQLAARSRLSRGRSRLASGGLLHARHASRLFPDYDVIFSDNERVGVFAALFLRGQRHRPRHVMLGHHLSPAKKRPLLLLARSGIDRLVVHSEAQRRLAVDSLGFAPGQVDVLSYQVDTEFWAPQSDGREDLICTAGLECRDYVTLIEAAAPLPIQVNIGAASRWSRKRSAVTGRELPGNFDVASYSYRELRALYDRSRFVIAPLLDVDFQAGITLILEAMSMAKAVVVTLTRGRTDAVVGPLWMAETTAWPESGPPLEASTAIYVLPGDSAALRSAIAFLLARPDLAAVLGNNGRRRAMSEFSLESFVERFAGAIIGRTERVQA